MRTVQIELKKVTCNSKPNLPEIQFFKKQFLERKPIPAVWIRKNKVVAFASTYFVLKELGVSPYFGSCPEVEVSPYSRMVSLRSTSLALKSKYSFKRSACSPFASSGEYNVII